MSFSIFNMCPANILTSPCHWLHSFSGDPDQDQWWKVCLDHGASKKPVNPLWSWIREFLWCTMIQTDLGSLIRMDSPVLWCTMIQTNLGSLIRMDSPVPLMHHDFLYIMGWNKKCCCCCCCCWDLGSLIRIRSGSPQKNAAIVNLWRGIGPFLSLFSGLYWAWVCLSLHNTSFLFPVLVVLLASMTPNPSSWNHEDSIQGKSYAIFLWIQVPSKMNHNMVTSLKTCCLFVCLFVILAGVVPSLDTSNEEVVDVLYRVQAMRLADAPRPRNTTPGGG